MGIFRLLMVLIAALAYAPAAFAHASLVASEPVDRGVVAQAPSSLKLTFNEPVSLLVFRLVGPGGHSVALKDVTAKDQTLTVELPGSLQRGTHLLSWRVVSADGHPVGGAITFSVGEPSAQPPAPQIESDRAVVSAIWLARLALYLGLFFGVGGAFYKAWIATGALARPVERGIAAVLACGFAAAVISVGLQGLDTINLPLSELRQTRLWAGGFATSYGTTAAIAAVACVLALVSLRSAPARWLATLALILVGIALAASGHASSAAPQLLTRPAVFLHGIAVAFWIGALVPLAAALRSGERSIAELARFSRVIPAAVAVLLMTGLALAVVQLGSVDALWTTSYGTVLFRKLVAVLLLLALAAVNRYALTRRMSAGDAQAARWLSISIKAEIAIAIVILGLVATWRFTPPPRNLQALAGNPVRVHIHTAQAMADLRFEPAQAGARSVIIALWDGNFAPLPAREVTLVISKPDAGIEPLRAPAGYVGETTWRVDGLRVPMSGRWHARVEVLINDFEKIAIEDDVDLP